MAIEKIKKVLIVGDKAKENLISDSIFSLGLIHVDEFDRDVLEDIGHFKQAVSSFTYDEENMQVNFILENFKKFGIDTKGFFKSFFPDDIEVSKADFERISQTFDLNGMYESISRLSGRFAELSEEEVSLSEEKKFLLSFKDFPFQFSIMQGTATTKSVICTAKTVNLNSLLVKEKDTIDNIYLDVFDSDKNISNIFILFLREDEDKILSLLRSYDIEQVSPPENLLGFANEEANRISSRLSSIEKEKNVILSKMRELYNLKRELIVYKDYIDSLRVKEQKKTNFLDGTDVFVLKGFVKERQLEDLKKLDGIEGVETFISDPEASDFVPVAIANNPIFRPFEFLVRLFGLPSYSNIDPTPVIAVLFSVFFGMALGDAFYGSLLAIFAFYFLRKYKDNPGSNGFFSILLYGGISATIVGILTGSFAGNFFATYFPSSAITHILKSLTVIDTNSPSGSVEFLVVALAIGIFTQLLGVLMSIVAKVKNKNYLDALFNGVGWLAFLPGLMGLFVVGKLPSLRIYDSILLYSGLGLLFIGGFMSIRTPLFKPIAALVNIYGIRSSYGISSFLGDVLSYLRLFALGLSSSILASSFNLMAKVIGSLFGNFGIVPLILILLALHTLAFMMNILGAFIHSMRLNFLEFFGRFYDIGGSSFSPFGIELKNTRIKKE
ncbi:MAG: V-type ATP synthase subunit I [Caldisericaceae bacterium]